MSSELNPSINPDKGKILYRHSPIRFHKLEVHWFDDIMTNEIIPELERMGYDIDKKPFEITPFHSYSNTAGLYYLLNPLNKKYICIDVSDNFGSRCAARHSKCRLDLVSQYDPSTMKDIKKIQPFTYSVFRPSDYDKVLSELRDLPKTESELWWHGKSSYSGRDEILFYLREYTSVKTKGECNFRTVGYLDYLREMATKKILLCLAGAGDLCHREIEAMGAGVPVIRPELKGRLREPLEPNVHYISVPRHSNPRKQARFLWEGYDRAIRNPALLQDISKKAMDYFNNYLHAKVRGEIILKMLKIKCIMSGSQHKTNV